MSKKATVLISVVALALITITFLLDKAVMTKSEIFQYVTENQEELLSFVSAESFADEQMQQYKRFCVTAWNDASVIQFETQSIGLGAASTYKGFYYVSDDNPVGFQGTDVAFSEQPPGLYWTDGTDNWMYVEKIIPHWYWFEAHF